ncbi:EAL domain-containing protein [Labrenzia sp. PHM005]|uniref:EAL domain-containing response regulator n=1 Tax=Labrenzia sp. PHM005 TaxID=2590016 RepID=UPI0011408821|nr:EAL domain-containing response regulator [Labrenzia sp. PHM005]QDG77178.1 EAL domain-containing response regulator [Labrenzia sp. PHM005]
MKIFVYDDEADFAEFVEEAVADFGHEAVIATNADEFADRFSAETDLIFLDLFMPDVNGIECIRFLAKTGNNARLVLMSGQDPAILSAAQEGARASGLTVLETLQKPISLNTIEAVLKKAEAEFETAKTNETPAPASDQTYSAENIRTGLADNQFFLVYQPQFRLTDTTVTGCEALIRWQHPQDGLVSPSAFIPAAEASRDTMAVLTDFVTETACKDLVTFSTITPGLTVSLNISASTFDDVQLPEKFLETTRAYGLDTNQIVLEVTETAASLDIGNAIDILTRLRMSGFGVSIDDFGTGYSSMEQIVQVPFTELKVDRRFVKDLLTSKKCRAICEISCQLAQKTNMVPVAEGVEDAETAQELHRIGFVLAQGYHFAKPMTAADLGNWLAGTQGSHASLAAS